MFISLNSLDSKISPHSLHSTNSASSSRLTICTRGCLQGCFVLTFCGGAGNLGVIFQDCTSGTSAEGWWSFSPEFHGILERLGGLSSPQALLCCGFVAKVRPRSRYPSSNKIRPFF